MNQEYLPIHMGLMGHIDSGKTALARALSEIISTAGLDAHSQSQQRGITIDLGFTFFPLENYMITLVDAPGHADLIKSVVSGANIIDIGVLIIDAEKGPQVQTGEHLVILDILQIPRLMIIINKIDLVEPPQLVNIEKQMKALLKETHFKSHETPILRASAKNNQGIAEIKTELLHQIQSLSLERNTAPPLIFMFDHHFQKKDKEPFSQAQSFKGRRKLGKKWSFSLQKYDSKIKSVQKWKTTTDHLVAGDRCGVAIQSVPPDAIHRGDIMTLKADLPRFQKSKLIRVDVEVSRFYNQGINFGQEITLFHGMRKLNGFLYPFYEDTQFPNMPIRLDPDSKSISDLDSNSISNLDSASKSDSYTTSNVFSALVVFDEEIYLSHEDIFLLARLDLPPKKLRVVGKAIYNNIEPKPIHKIKTKVGQIKNPTYSAKSVIVEGWAQSLKGAQTLINQTACAPLAKIVSTFGQKGNVEVLINTSAAPISSKETPTSLEVGQTVEYKILKKIMIKELDL